MRCDAVTSLRRGKLVMRCCRREFLEDHHNLPRHLQTIWNGEPVNGKRVFDWRWLLQRDDSQWYPTMRPFRQKKKGKWDEVIAQVESELKRLLSY
jgi:hypothetical protein